MTATPRTRRGRVAQEMHTPDDITNPNPPEDDQPYAGILYVDSVLYARSERWAHAWELKLGVVGPASQAENAQKDFHELIGGDEPMGWDTQLPNEPVINIGLTTAHLWAEGNAGGSAKWRLVPVGHVGLGTYFTGVGVGMYGEVGWNLVDALGGTSLRDGLNAASTVGVGPVDGWSVSFFGGLGGHAIAHYLPLDGTVFQDSRSVDTKPFVGNASLGFSVRHGTFALSLATTFTTKAFDTQEESAEFGSLSVSWFSDERCKREAHAVRRRLPAIPLPMKREAPHGIGQDSVGVSGESGCHWRTARVLTLVRSCLRSHAP